MDFGLGETDAGLFKIFVCGAAFGLGKTEKMEPKMTEQESVYGDYERIYEIVAMTVASIKILRGRK